MERFLEKVRESMKIKAPLDGDFVPASKFVRLFEEEAKREGALPVAIAVEGAEGLVSTVETVCFENKNKYCNLNIFFIERVVKSLLWAYGGFKVTIGAPEYVAEALREQYRADGKRDFDYEFVKTVYERNLEVISAPYGDVPRACPRSKPIGRHLDGCRLGLDAGGSDIKISAVLDGKAVFSKETVWLPKVNENPEYHYKYITDVLKLGASHLPRVDAVGVSSAGVYINNKTMIASLFMKVPKEEFDAKVKDIYVRAARELGENIPVEIANDGDVTALAGAMSLSDTNVLGIAMGTSEAAGFADENGNITGWLNELAFVPCDFNPAAAVDEWSGDYGCGVKYFSQDAVAKLAPKLGIEFDEKMTPAEKLKHIQGLLGKDGKIRQIYETIGVYLGYTLGYYARFYSMKHVLILGRVTSGEGGAIIQELAEKVLAEEFSELALKLHLPDESSRRVGQSFAAASLPKIQ